MQNLKNLKKLNLINPTSLHSSGVDMGIHVTKSVIPNEDRGKSVSELSEARLLKTLDIMSARLANIEERLSEIIRLEERINSQERVTHSHGIRLNRHSDRLREAEMWQAGHGDSSSVERMIVNMKEDISRINDKVGDLEKTTGRTKGQKDIVKEILKWMLAIAAAIVIFGIKGK